MFNTLILTIQIIV